MIKFKLPTELLVQFATDLGPTIPSLTSSEILKGMYINFEKDVITAIAFNGAVAVRLERDLDKPLEIEPFDIVLTHPKLVSLLKKLSGVTTTFKYDPERESVDLLSGGSKYRLQAMDASEYPNVNEIIGRMGTVGTLLAEDVTSAYSATTGFNMKEETRPILQGINHEFLGGYAFSIHATDSRILRKVSVNMSDVLDAPDIGKSYSLPALFTSQMYKLLNKREDCTVRFRVSDRAAAYDWEVMETRTTYTVFGRTFDGAYPNIHALSNVPENAMNLHMSKSTVLDLLSRIQSTSDAAEHVVLAFNGSKGKMLTRGQFPSIENFSLESPFPSDEPFLMTISTTYLQTAVRSFVEDNLMFQFTDAERPLFIHSIDDDAEGMALVLPIRTSAIEIDWEGEGDVIDLDDVPQAAVKEEAPAPIEQPVVEESTPVVEEVSFPKPQPAVSGLAMAYNELFTKFDNHFPDDVSEDDEDGLSVDLHEIEAIDPKTDAEYADKMNLILGITDAWIPDSDSEYYDDAVTAINGAYSALNAYRESQAVTQ
ncbi:hypothetical protein ACQR3P_29065 [Rhodococcus sp. IEGM1300]